jgi:type II secretory pathway predicted ATPase ExeA
MSRAERPRWLTHFGLSEPPFDKSIDDGVLWMPSSRREVVDEVVAAVHERRHVLLTGEPGVGKTCVLRAVRRCLPQAGFRLTYCHNATLGRRDFYRQLCLALGLTPSATAAAVFYAVSTHVEELARESVHPVFLLDEGHLLHQDVLDHLHIICNYEWDSAPLLSLVLVGLPELRDRMQLRRNRSLWSRVHVRLALADPLPEDAVEYVHYRLKNAGGDQELFSSDALAILHEASAGHLRSIDRLATAALKAAARRKLKRIDRELIQHVAADEGR